MCVCVGVCGISTITVGFYSWCLALFAFGGEGVAVFRNLVGLSLPWTTSASSKNSLSFSSDKMCSLLSCSNRDLSLAG